MPKINTVRRSKYPILPIFFSLLGLLLTGYGIGINDSKTVIMGAFLFLAFLSPVLRMARYAKLKIVHELCLFTVGILGCYVFSLTLWGIIILFVGVVALADATYSIIRKKPQPIKHDKH